MEIIETDCLVIGAGLAGSAYALQVARADDTEPGARHDDGRFDALQCDLESKRLRRVRWR